MFILENIVKQELNKAFLLCEIKIAIDDVKKRGFADQIGQMYANSLKAFKPISITGKIGVSGDDYKNITQKLKIKNVSSDYDGSYFSITLKNGDVIEVFRNTSPAYAYIILNGVDLVYITDPSDLFRKSMPDLVRQEYSNHILSKKYEGFK
jgi:hypothetical protein